MIKINYKRILMGKVEKSQQGSIYYIPRKEFLGKSHNFLWGDLSLKME